VKTKEITLDQIRKIVATLANAYKKIKGQKRSDAHGHEGCDTQSGRKSRMDADGATTQDA
jgi:hypothetical protein